MSELSSQIPPLLLKDLRREVGLLHQACLAYDGGYSDAFINIARAVTVISSNHGHTSLLSHLRTYTKEPLRFNATPTELPGNGSLFDCPLVFWAGKAVTVGEMPLGDTNWSSYVPRYDIRTPVNPKDPPDLIEWRLLKYDQYWREIVVSLGPERRFSRYNIIDVARNRLGAAHPHRAKMTAAELAISDTPVPRFVLRNGDTVLAELANGPLDATIRQIGYEVQLTIDRMYAHLLPGSMRATSVLRPRSSPRGIRLTRAHGPLMGGVSVDRLRSVASSTETAYPEMKWFADECRAQAFWLPRDQQFEEEHGLQVPRLQVTIETGRSGDGD